MADSEASLSLGIWQDSGIAGDIDSNLEIISEATKRASHCGVDLLVFPECFLTGYFNGDSAVSVAQQIDQNTVSDLQETAKSNATAILVGYYEAKKTKLYNSAMLIGADGKILSNYQKRTLFGDWEHLVFTPGNQHAQVFYKGFKISVLICFDIEFPELARECAHKGTDLIVVPTSLMAPNDHITNHLVPARAIENQLYIAYANRIGREYDLHFIGKSAIFDPLGAELVRASSDLPELIYAKIFKSVLCDARSKFSYLDEVSRIKKSNEF